MPTLPSSETSALTLGVRRAAILAALSALTLTAVARAGGTLECGSKRRAPGACGSSAGCADDEARRAGIRGHADDSRADVAGSRCEPAGAAARRARRNARRRAVGRDRPVRRQGPLEVGAARSEWRTGRHEMAGARRLLRDRRQERLDVHARELRRRAAAHRMGDALGRLRHQPGSRQQRRDPDGPLRGAGARHVQQPHLLRRWRRVALRPVAAARQRTAPARRMAGLRHHLRGAALRGGQAGETGVRDRFLERRARPASQGARGRHRPPHRAEVHGASSRTAAHAAGSLQSCAVSERVDTEIEVVGARGSGLRH